MVRDTTSMAVMSRMWQKLKPSHIMIQVKYADGYETTNYFPLPNPIFHFAPILRMILNIFKFHTLF